MTERSKPTRGPWTIFDNPSGNYGLEIRALVKVKARKVVCRLGGPDREANARLIAEAGTVYHETGLTPQQLRADLNATKNVLAATREHVCRLEVQRDELNKQKADLLAEMESIRQFGADTLSGRADGGLDDREWQRDSVLEMTRRARAAIASVEGRS